MMQDNNAQKPFPWAVTVIAVAVVIIAAFALYAYLKTGHAVKDSVDKGISLAGKAVDKVPEIARNFMTGRITETFRESIPEVTSTGGDVLELAVSKSDETFIRSDEKRIGWDYIYLGTTVVEIRAPVTYRYHLRLSDNWRLATRGNVCMVLAPAIRPSLPPAIHTEGMEKRAESGWARFDKNDQLAELEKSLTPTLERRATNATHLKLVREACRQSVAGFVKTWLMQKEQWRSDRFTAIIVVFPDEVQVSSDQDLLNFQHEPTVKMD